MLKKCAILGILTLITCLCSTAAYGDLTADSLPHEFFPLVDVPLQEPQLAAPRSELQSPDSIQRWNSLKAQILKDFQGRVSPEFSVPYGLSERTSFWFDIYTRYGEAHHVIHHVLYPWIIFRVYDTTQTLVNGRGPIWLRRDRAAKLAQKEVESIRRTLKRLAQKTDYSRLNAQERYLYNALVNVPGTRKAVFREAAQNIRSQLGQKDFFERGLQNSGRYLPLMEAEFRRQNIPVELSRLPFVESSFNERAFSKVGASGIWQIMPDTGRAYMIVNDHIDERNSPLKATRVAAYLLRTYARALGQWPLAITAYNNGIGNIQIAMKKAGSNDLATVIARYHRGSFQFASSNFFTCFLAAMYAEKYSDLVFKNILRRPVMERDTIRLGSNTRAANLPRLTGASRAQLLDYNMDLKVAFRKNAIVPRGLQIFVPAGRRDLIERRSLGVEPRKPKRKSRWAST